MGLWSSEGQYSGAGPLIGVTDGSNKPYSVFSRSRCSPLGSKAWGPCGSVNFCYIPSFFSPDLSFSLFIIPFWLCLLGSCWSNWTIWYKRTQGPAGEFESSPLTVYATRVATAGSVVNVSLSLAQKQDDEKSYEKSASIFWSGFIKIYNLCFCCWYAVRKQEGERNEVMWSCLRNDVMSV